MPQSPPDPPKSENDRIGLKAGAIVTAICAGIVWVVNHFDAVRPVLEHPVMLFVVLALWTFAAFGFGGGAVYTLIVHPMERRLNKAESLISELRRQERDLIRMDGERLARITGLERDVAHMTDTLNELRQALQRVQSEQSLGRRAMKSLETDEPGQ